MAMAAGARRVLGADVGLGLTGVAGPGRAGRACRSGTLCIGLALGEELTAVTRPAAGAAAADAAVVGDLRARPAPAPAAGRVSGASSRVGSASPAGSSLVVGAGAAVRRGVAAAVGGRGRAAARAPGGRACAGRARSSGTSRCASSARSRSAPARGRAVAARGRAGRGGRRSARPAVRLGREVLALPGRRSGSASPRPSTTRSPASAAPPEPRPFRGHLTLARGKGVRGLSGPRLLPARPWSGRSTRSASSAATSAGAGRATRPSPPPSSGARP